MKFRLLLPLLGLLGTISGRAADSADTSASQPPVTDTIQVTARYHEVLTRPEYQDIEEPGVDSHFKDWISQWIAQLEAKFGQFKYANEMPAVTSLLMVLLVALSVAGLIYIMVRLTRRRASMEAEFPTDFPGQKTFRPPEFYDKEIGEAIGAENWHAAWLAAWRQFLSRLESRRLVEADRTRTNREYLSQLRAQTLPHSADDLLSSLVDSYDRFIYGRKIINESDWKLFHQQIDETALLLHIDDKAAGLRAPQGGA